MELSSLLSRREEELASKDLMLRENEKKIQMLTNQLKNSSESWGISKIETKTRGLGGSEARGSPNSNKYQMVIE